MREFNAIFGRRMLELPHYIAVTGAADAPPTHRWEGRADFMRENHAMDRAFSALSTRAALACGAALAEWVAWRMHKLSDFDTPLRFIESVWASQADARYSKRWDPNSSPGTTGTVNGALRASAYVLLNVLNGAQVPTANAVTFHVVYLWFLARHVLPDRKPFDAWLKRTLRRMKELYPRDAADLLGPPVPRAAFDPDVPMVLEAMPERLDAFLRQLDPRANEFLATPEEMRAAGFPGTPYRYPG